MDTMIYIVKKNSRIFDASGNATFVQIFIVAKDRPKYFKHEFYIIFKLDQTCPVRMRVGPHETC